MEGRSPIEAAELPDEEPPPPPPPPPEEPEEGVGVGGGGSGEGDGEEVWTGAVKLMVAGSE